MPVRPERPARGWRWLADGEDQERGEQAEEAGQQDRGYSIEFVPVRTAPAQKAAVAAPSWWPANTQPNTSPAFSAPKCWAVSLTVGGTVATQSRP